MNESSETNKFKGLQLLSKCKADDLRMLLHQVVDKICGRKPPLFTQYQHVWPIREWWNVTESVSYFVRHAVENGWSKDEISEHLKDLSNEYQLTIYDGINCRKEEIIQRLSDETCQSDDAYLIDFDWHLNLVVGSDKMANLAQPLASVMLYIQEGENRKEVLLEMDKEQLSTFITALENANKAMSNLQS